MGVDDWDEIALGDLVDVKHGYAFQGRYFDDAPPGDVLLTPGNFQIGGGFKRDKLKYFRGPVPDEFVLEPGDLLVTMTDLSRNGDTLGYPALVPSTDGVRYLHNQRLGRVTVTRPDRLDASFLYYLLCTRRYRDEIVAGATGTTVRHTSPTKIKSYRAPIPPIEQQRQIANVLGTLDAKLTLNQRMYENLTELVSAVFRAWFVDFAFMGTPSAEAASRYGIPPDLVAQLPVETTETSLGEIPAGWDVAALPDVSTITGGGTPKRAVAEYWNGDIAWFSIRDAPAEHEVWAIDTVEHITEAGIANSAARLLPSHATIISARGTVGRLALTAVPMAINQSCYAFESHPEVGDYFVYFSVRNAVTKLKQRAHGSVFDTITLDTLRSVEVVRPPRPMIDAFEAAVDPYMQLIRQLRFNDRTLIQTRCALLPRLLSGALLVPVGSANP